MKWMDMMVNVTVVGDVVQHLCEIQIVHSKMLVARKNLGGHKVCCCAYCLPHCAPLTSTLINHSCDRYLHHKPYSQMRAASEILEVLRGTRAQKPKSSKFTLKLFTSSQKIAPPAAKELHKEPAAAAAADRRPSPPPPATPPPATEWSAHITEEGHTYYASAVTGETQWEVPETMMVVGNDAHGDNPMNHVKM
jgi:hypothetical protein